MVPTNSPFQILIKFNLIEFDSDNGRLAHTLGPLDGSLYAKVVKNEAKQVIGQESATGTPSVSSHSPLRYIDPSAVSAPSGGQRRHL